MLAIINDKDYK